MCRSIRTLRAAEPAHDGDVVAAARQYVRKISGYREPSARNAEAFQAAVAEIADATTRLLAAVGPAPVPGPETKPPPRPPADQQRFSSRPGRPRAGS